MEGNKAVVSGEEGMKAVLGRCASEHREDAAGVVFLVVAALPRPPRQHDASPRWRFGAV